MEIIEDNFNSDASYYNDSESIFHLNPTEQLSSIFEMGDQFCDESLNMSFENCNMSTDDSFKMNDDISLKTSSSIENDFEVMIPDYSKILSCLTSECYQRSDNEIFILSQLLQSIPQFMCMNSSELELICQSARLVLIDSANTLIIKRYSTLVDWYFCLCGSLRLDNEEGTILKTGNFIGATFGSQDFQISDYNLYSQSDNCKLMVIGKNDLDPLKQLNKVIIKTNEEDKTIVAVYEASLKNSNIVDTYGYVLSKGTPEVLMNSLFANPNWVHRDFVEDFFMTHRLFSPKITYIMEEIVNGLYEDSQKSKDKFDVLIRWMMLNFVEFEKDDEYIRFLNNVEGILINQKKHDLLYALYCCCSNKASIRKVKSKISFVNNIVPVNRDNEQTSFYIVNVEDNKLLKNGDVIVSIEQHSQDYITKELIENLCEEQKPLSLSVRNDVLGYHEYILKDLSVDSFSLHSTPSNSSYDRCNSDKISDSFSVSTNDNDLNDYSIVTDSPSHLKKRPSLIPNFFSNLQTGTVGRFFKNPKNYSNLLKRKFSNSRPITALPNNRSISDVSNDLNFNFQRPSTISGSIISINRFSRRLKYQRKSTSSNPEIIKSFDERDMGEADSLLSISYNLIGSFTIRIYWKDVFLGYPETPGNSNLKSDLKFTHLMITPTMPVSEVIILALLKLNVSSTSSNNFYLVEVKVDQSNVMIHEKILKPTTNLKLNAFSRFYLKHSSIVGCSLISQKEADKMIDECQKQCLVHLAINHLVVQLFLQSHAFLCEISPNDLISHVAGSKGTLRTHKHLSNHDHEFNKYIQLSDLYKNWVITEICSEQFCVTKRAKIIQYFIWMAYKALHLGHIDLFFSLMSGLDSTAISRLVLSWDKVSSQDKKLYKKMKPILDVSGNMRNLRNLHQDFLCPFIPVTAMVIKDLTMIDETNSTFVEGFINGLQVNSSLVNFDKMRKMAKLSRIFVNSTCSCTKDKSKPVCKHSFNCSFRIENSDRLEILLLKRLEVDYQLNPQAHSAGFEKKHTNSNLSLKSSSSESISDSVSMSKNNQEHLMSKAFEQQRMKKKIEDYLSTLESFVIDDPNVLSKMSTVCEPNAQSYQNTLKTKHSKSPRVSNDLIINHNHFQSDEINPTEISEKAAEILGLKNKSKIHTFKKSGS